MLQHILASIIHAYEVMGLYGRRLEFGVREERLRSGFVIDETYRFPSHTFEGAFMESKYSRADYAMAPKEIFSKFH